MSRIKRSDKAKAEDFGKNLAMLVCYHRSVSPQSVSSDDSLFKGVLDILPYNPSIQSSMNFNSIQKNCLKVYEEELGKVKEIFSNLAGQISLSADLLMNVDRRGSVSEYLCLSAHFIDDDWKMRKWVIKFCEAYGQETVHPTRATLRTLKEFDIEGKIFSVTDVGANDTANMVKEKVQETKELPLNGQLFHVRCCSDVISGMVQEGFKMIDDIIFKVQSLSWSKSEPLWHLTSFKLRDALELEAMGEFSSADDYDVPSKEEWEKVRGVCRIADRIYEITEPLFKIKRPTANHFMPHLHEILAFLMQEAASSEPFVKAVADKMLKTFSEYWKETYLVLAVAAFMDPRYKMKLIEFSSFKLGDHKAVPHVLDTLRKVYAGYVVQNAPKEYPWSDSNSDTDDNSDSGDEDEEGSEMLVTKERQNLGDTLNLIREYKSTIQGMSEQQHKSDLDVYLEEPVLPWTGNFDVLDWWKDNCFKYPQLSRMARDFLTIPLSVAYSYDAYYTVRREAERTVTNLKPELMNALMCTRSWKLGYKKP